MIRGTTPTLTFELPFSADQISEIWITIAQNKVPITTKSLQDISVDPENDKLISIELSQVETLKLCDRYKAQIQVRAKMSYDGNAIASEILEVPVASILKDGII